MNKIVVAVGKKGGVTVLVGFPDDEEHAGLHEMLDEFEREAELDLPVGVYYMQPFIDGDDVGTLGNPEYDYVFLNIKDEAILWSPV